MAIPEKVSPGATVYVFPAGFAGGLTASLAPARILAGSAIWFQVTRSLTLTPYLAAIRDRVSPGWTVWVFRAASA